ncbi:MAG: GNAT family N-acetyltransferase [Erysipelotrichia bacterium]|nr:GNAT family N-acetyltransferase [Erysipelotrichia bacterium]
MLGYVKGSLKSWSNCYRISYICIFDDHCRHNGIGTMLMKKIIKEAKVRRAKMAVLETQTCNENVVAFY